MSASTVPAYANQNGKATTADDPERLVFYSACCNYWTDDWSRLSYSGPSRIPCCPTCGSLGFQAKAGAMLAPGKPKEQCRRLANTLTSFLGKKR